MTLDYLLRLAWLSLACFALIHVTIAAVVAAVSPLAIHLAGRMRPRSGAGLAFAFRLAPAVLSLAAVILICVPSYLLHEPLKTAERAGTLCMIAAAGGLLLWAASLARAARAAGKSARYLKVCLKTGTSVTLPGEDQPACMLDGAAPSMMLAGVARPLLILSSDTLQALTADQLAVALRHERAHRASRDNLKRLVILAVPGLLPGWSGLRRLELAWARLTEWAADDDAVAGDARVSVSLASALLCVARLGGQPHPAWLVSCPMAASDDLPGRIDRLLAPPDPPCSPIISVKGLTLAAVLMAGAIVAVPARMSIIVHAALEQLMR